MVGFVSNHSIDDSPTSKMSFQLFDVDQEYEKDKELKRSDVKILSEWMKKQPHLPKANEQQLILFLQSCYYRLEAAKTTIDNFFTVRTLCPDLFGVPSMEILKKAMSVGTMNILPGRTPEGFAAVLMKLIDTNPENYNQIHQINFMDMGLMRFLHQSGPCKGVLALFDMKGLSFGHMARFNLAAIKKHTYFVQEASPVRIRGIHYINMVPFTDKIIAMIKPFMKKELVEMLHFHSDSMDTLYKFVPKEMMPKDYGGEAPSIATLHEQNCTKMLENMEFYTWLEAQKVDESKRPGKPKNASDIFGLDGTFKKLEVD